MSIVPSLVHKEDPSEGVFFSSAFAAVDIGEDSAAFSFAVVSTGHLLQLFLQHAFIQKGLSSQAPWAAHGSQFSSSSNSQKSSMEFSFVHPVPGSPSPTGDLPGLQKK